MMRYVVAAMTVALVANTTITIAHAQDAAADSSASLSSEGLFLEGEAEEDTASGDLQPEAGLWELGVFGGLRWVSKRADLFPMAGQNDAVDDPLFELGLRAAYFPQSYLGAELEGALAPSGKVHGESVSVWAGRGHMILQVPGSRVTPFALAGAGMMASTSDTLNEDMDGAVHYGLGVKAALTPLVSVRFDARDTVTLEDPDNESGLGVAHNPELLLGVSLTLGRADKAPPPPTDRDGDGFVDTVDRCPDEPGIEPDGCPDRDPDKDGVLVPDDKCPTEAGVAPDGCPDLDPDKDGVLVPDDKCPTVAGVAPDGCPDKDPDKDGILDPNDQCPTEPETMNGYQDKDGCPDELPEAVKKFSGVIAGIEFDVNKDTIRNVSHKVLDEAVKVLTDFPDLRILVTGHTDSDGTRDRNLDLSRRRAESVKSYLVSKGVSADRIETRGAGQEEPVADNKTAQGKQKNRRIEFKILQ